MAATLKIRDASGNWIDTCSTSINFRDTDGNWQQFKSGDHVWDGTAWQQVVCEVPEDSVYVANNYGKPLNIITPSSLAYSLNLSQARVFTEEGIYTFSFGSETDDEIYWKFNVATYNPSDPSTYETGTLPRNTPFSKALSFGDYFIVSPSQPGPA